MRFGCLQADGEDLYWQEGRPDGSTTLVRLRDGAFEDLGPARSTTYGYGGRAFAVRDGRVVKEEGGPTGDHEIAPDGGVYRVREDGDTAAIVGDHPVVAGRDFYAAPRLSPDGRLAYLCWDHPHMPWDAAELWVDGEHVAGGDGVSAMQPGWLRDGTLLWIDDRSGWWNLHGHPIDAEVGYPAWQLGFQNWCELHDGRIAFTARRNGFEQLLVDGDPFDLPFTEFQWLVPFRDGLACIAGGPSDPAALVAIDRIGRVQVLRPGGDVAGPVTTPEHVSFGHAHALVHAPAGAEALIVRVHGGPTAHAGSTYDPEVQFFTQRGFAVADVDYRGSTGYGRAFRDALYGHWGVADVEDCVACARHLGYDRAVIRGSSAGGYTVLRALTTSDAFAAGSCRYAVTDPAALDDDHRFESRYTDRLGGAGAVDPAALSAPVILFHGLDDQVVPPEQSRRMAAALEAKGLDHELHLFEGEGHGFRRAETRRAVLEAEAAFLARAVGFPAS